MVETHLAAHQRALAVMFAVAVLATTTVGGSAWAQTPLRIDPGIIDPRGLAWDGSHFWIIGGEHPRLYAIDPDTGDAEREIDLSPLGLRKPMVIAWQQSDRTFWLGDDGTRRIYKFEVVTTNPYVNLVRSFSAPDEDLNEIVMTGLAWDGRQGRTEGLWLCTSMGLCTTIRKLEAERGDILLSFYPVCAPRGLAILGDTLWTVALGDGLIPSRLMAFDIEDDDWTRIKASRQAGWVVAADRLARLAVKDQNPWLLDSKAKKLFPVNPD